MHSQLSGYDASPVHGITLLRALFPVPGKVIRLSLKQLFPFPSQEAEQPFFLSYFFFFSEQLSLSNPCPFSSLISSVQIVTMADPPTGLLDPR